VFTVPGPPPAHVDRYRRPFRETDDRDARGSLLVRADANLNRWPIEGQSGTVDLGVGNQVALVSVCRRKNSNDDGSVTTTTGKKDLFMGIPSDSLRVRPKMAHVFAMGYRHRRDCAATAGVQGNRSVLVSLDSRFRGNDE
jgi:hypothetical protein